MELNFTWKQKTGQYQTGENLFLNRIQVAQYEWNITRSRGDDTEDTRYSGRVNLPSLTNDKVYGSTPEDIKAKVEWLVISWFKAALKE